MNRDSGQLTEEWRYLITIESETLSDDSRIYVASHPEIAHCFAQGSTVEEALTNLHAVFADIVDHCIEHGLPLP